jgi:hypothetical protein
MLLGVLWLACLHVICVSKEEQCNLGERDQRCPRNGIHWFLARSRGGINSDLLMGLGAKHQGCGEPIKHVDLKLCK